MRRISSTLAFLAAVALALVGSIGYLGSIVWWFDLFANFRPHYIMGGAALMFLAVLLRAWRTVLAAVLAIGISSWAVLQVPVADPPPDAKGPTLIVGSFNVLFNNTLTDAAVRFAEMQPFDVIVFQEFSGVFLPSLEKLRARYPHQAAFRRSNGGTDVVLVSRHPLVDPKMERESERRIRIVTAGVDIEGQRLQIIGMHPPVPLLPHLAATRDRHFEIVTELVKASPHPTIVVGDFNATLWSRPLRDLFAATSLRAVGPWPKLTYPSTYPWPVRVPIDTVLLSPGLSLVSLETAPRFGSDHFPIVAHIAVGGGR